MRMSASRIRSINRSVARVNGIICGESDAPRRVYVESMKLPALRHSAAHDQDRRRAKTPQRLKAISGIGESLHSLIPGKFDRVSDPGYNHTTNEGGSLPCMPNSV